jgi:hypothetical protein
MNAALSAEKHRKNREKREKKQGSLWLHRRPVFSTFDQRKEQDKSIQGTVIIRELKMKTKARKKGAFRVDRTRKEQDKS